MTGAAVSLEMGVSIGVATSSAGDVAMGEVATRTRLLFTTSGDGVEAISDATGLASATGLADDEATASPLPATAAGALESSALVQPLLAVIAAGQATCLNETVGLSAPANQLKRQLHPSWRAAGKLEQDEEVDIPPY